MTTVARNAALEESVGNMDSEITQLLARIGEMQAAKAGNGGNLPDNLKAEWQAAHDRKNAIGIAAAKDDAVKIYTTIILANTPGSSDEKSNAVLTTKIAGLVINNYKGADAAKKSTSTRDRAGIMVDLAMSGSVLGAGSDVTVNFLEPLSRVLSILPPAKCDNILYALGLATGKTIKGDGLANIKADLAAYSA